MICTEMIGRLGNQMFRYAYARALQEQYQEPLLFSFKDIERQYDPAKGWENSLKYFNIVEYETYQGASSLMREKTSPIQRFIAGVYFTLSKRYKDDFDKRYRFQIKWQPIMGAFGIYGLHMGYYPYKTTRVKDKFIIGCCECEKYFNSVRPKLLEEFTPLDPPAEKNCRLYEIMECSESVCISIRRGDFVENKKFRETYDVCTKEYYYRAVEEMAARVKNPHFIVFSDDIPWIKENMTFPYPVDYEDGDDTVQEKLRMMYSCKHFIISNSTFSWWAQYLGRNPEKVVISPNRWYNNLFKTALISENWVLIDPDSLEVTQNA